MVKCAFSFLAGLVAIASPSMVGTASRMCQVEASRKPEGLTVVPLTKS